MKINVGGVYILLNKDEVKSLLDGKDIRIAVEDCVSKANVLVLRLDDDEE